MHRTIQVRAQSRNKLRWTRYTAFRSPVPEALGTKWRRLLSLPKPPITNETVYEFYDWLFAPWVKAMGLSDFDISPGKAVAILPQNEKLQFSSSAICGQAIMAAVDTITSMAMATTDRFPKGTAYQHTHFLRPALSEDLRIEANVLRFGKGSAFAECKVTFVNSGKLVSHASLEFAF